MGLGGPVVSLVGLVASASFRPSSPVPKMVSSRPSFVSSSIGRRNIAGPPRGDARAPGLVHWPIRNIKPRQGEPCPACRAARGGVGGTYAPYRALPRLIRSRHQRPSGRGARHAVTLCDRLIVAVASIPAKSRCFRPRNVWRWFRRYAARSPQKAGCAFDCTTYDNLTVTAAQTAGATIMIRGLRDGTDLDYEMQLAGMNEAMAPEVHTVFVPASVGGPPDHRHTGAPNRPDGWGFLRFRAVIGRGQAQGQIRQLAALSALLYPTS